MLSGWSKIVLLHIIVNVPCAAIKHAVKKNDWKWHWSLLEKLSIVFYVIMCEINIVWFQDKVKWNWTGTVVVCLKTNHK